MVLKDGMILTPCVEILTLSDALSTINNPYEET